MPYEAWCSSLSSVSRTHSPGSMPMTAASGAWPCWGSRWEQVIFPAEGLKAASAGDQHCTEPPGGFVGSFMEVLSRLVTVIRSCGTAAWCSFSVGRRERP